MEIQSNGSTSQQEIYAGVAAVGAVGGAALAVGLTSDAYRKKKKGKGGVDSAKDASIADSVLESTTTPAYGTREFFKSKEGKKLKKENKGRVFDIDDALEQATLFNDWIDTPDFIKDRNFDKMTRQAQLEKEWSTPGASTPMPQKIHDKNAEPEFIQRRNAARQEVEAGWSQQGASTPMVGEAVEPEFIRRRKANLEERMTGQSTPMYEDPLPQSSEPEFIRRRREKMNTSTSSTLPTWGDTGIDPEAARLHNLNHQGHKPRGGRHAKLMKMIGK